jgi:hypothetical protein
MAASGVFLKLEKFLISWNSFPLGVGPLPADFKGPYLHYFRFDESRDPARFEDGNCARNSFSGAIGVRPTRVYIVSNRGDNCVSSSSTVARMARGG